MFTGGRESNLVISPDGTRVVYTSGQAELGTIDSAGGVLYVRAVDQLDGAPLRGTLGARAPFFSPDGNWIGFDDRTSGALKKMPVLGGPAVTVCPLTSQLRGASWGTDDTIIFAESGRAGLFRVAAAGGDPEVRTTPNGEGGEIAHRWPEILPGGRSSSPAPVATAPKTDRLRCWTW